MQLLNEIFPLIAFYIAFHIGGIYWATGVFIIASALQMAYTYWRKKRFEKIQVMTFILVLIFGGLTIILHDAVFIKVKVTVVTWLFAAATFYTQHFTETPLVKHLMGHQLELPTLVWKKLNSMWTKFFFLSGALNIVIAYYFSTATWVDFKAFGLTLLTLFFMAWQFKVLWPYVNDQAQKKTIKNHDTQ